jgi:hypothetical protein
MKIPVLAATKFGSTLLTVDGTSRKRKTFDLRSWTRRVSSGEIAGALAALPENHHWKAVPSSP